MADTIKLKIKENITELRAMKFPICDECIKDLREIIKAHKEDN